MTLSIGAHQFTGTDTRFAATCRYPNAVRYSGLSTFTRVQNDGPGPRREWLACPRTRSHIGLGHDPQVPVWDTDVPTRYCRTRVLGIEASLCQDPVRERLKKIAFPA